MAVDVLGIGEEGFCELAQKNTVDFLLLFGLLKLLGEFEGIGFEGTTGGYLVSATKLIVKPEVLNAVRPFGEKHLLPLRNRGKW
jgi:hypothetical protein